MIKKGPITGIMVHDLESTEGFVCDACIQAKMTSLPLQIGHQRARKHLDRLHSDICGEFEHPMIVGNQYFATLINDMSGMIWLHPLKHKGDFVDWFINLDRKFLNQYGWHTGTLRTDNGGEYVNQRLHDYCSENGILLELTVPHTPQQNSVAEWANCTLTECIQALLKDQDCPLSFWGEAASTATYCLN